MLTYIPTNLDGMDVLLITDEDPTNRGTGREITKAQAQAPLGHMIGRFAAEVTAVSHDDMCALAKEIGVNYYVEKNERTSHFIFRGPAGTMQRFHERCQEAEPSL